MDVPDRPETEIIVDADAWPDARDLESLCETALAALRRQLGGGWPGGLCVLFTDDTAMQELNRRFRNTDRPTNVLSFPAHLSDTGRAGDIALGQQTVFRESDERSIPVNDHIAHLLIHGVLHLQGYDHQTETEAEEMESIERAALLELGIADPYEARQ